MSRVDDVTTFDGGASFTVEYRRALPEVTTSTPRMLDHVNPDTPGKSIYGKRANFTRLVLGCIKAKFCKYIVNIP